MMKTLDDKVSVAGQVDPADVPALAQQGIAMIINNRPDDEEAGQPSNAAIAAAAAAAGIDYRYIPVGSSGLSQNQVAAMAEALKAANGPTLAFCRSGTRSTFLWALAEASGGRDAGELAARASAAGYDLSPIGPYLG